MSGFTTGDPGYLSNRCDRRRVRHEFAWLHDDVHEVRSTDEPDDLRARVGAAGYRASLSGTIAEGDDRARFETCRGRAIERSRGFRRFF